MTQTGTWLILLQNDLNIYLYCIQIDNYTLLTHDNVLLVQTSLRYLVTKFMEIFSYQGCKYYTLLIHFIMKEKKNEQGYYSLN